MKKIFFSALVLLTCNSLLAQTNTATPGSSNLNAPNTVTTRFNADYPGMQPTWSVDGENYRAEYRSNNLSHSVTYDSKGKVVGSEEQLSMGNYPTAIGDYYTKKYPGETYEVWSSMDASGDKTYYTSRSSETIWFDNSGKYKSTTKSKKRKK